MVKVFLALVVLFGSTLTGVFDETFPGLFTDTVLPSEAHLSPLELEVLKGAATREGEDPTITRSRHA